MKNHKIQFCATINPEYAEQLEWILESFGKRILKYDATAFDPKKIKFG